MIKNVTKKRLLDGETVVGCFVRSADAGFAEYVATAGWDFLVLDGEHGSASPDRVGDLVRACEVRGVTPIVRVPSRDSGAVLRCLDAGAAGILFPWVSSAEEAKAAVTTTKYAPLGSRGLAGNRATDWTVTEQATAHANEMILVLAQIETREAVDNVEELCSVEGVDVLFIGPTDLSQSLGVPGDLSHPTVLRSIERVARAVSKSDKSLGLFAGSAEFTQLGLESGATFIATSVEVLLGSPMREYVRSIQARSE